MKFMFNDKPFSGVITAVVTPFDENNKVNEAQMKALVNRQIESGVKGILVLGGSGGICRSLYGGARPRGKGCC